MENGQPIVGYEPHGLAAGFKAIVKGTDDLAEDFSRWQITTGTTSLHYFRVEIVPSFPSDAISYDEAAKI